MATIISQVEVTPAAGDATDTEISLPLTLYDMPWLFYFRIMRRLLFFSLPNISTQTFIQTVIPNLQTSLSLTLKHFLPLAGNLVISPLSSEDNYLNSDIFSQELDSCTVPPELRYVPGDSVSVTFAQSAADFTSLTANHARDVNEFYPFVPRLTEGDEANPQFIPVLAVKVTVFPGYGLCIGTTHHHVVGDGNSMISFTKAWATINKLGGDVEDFLLPFYDRKVVKDPYGIAAKMFDEMKKGVPIVPSEAEISTPRINKVRATYIMSRKDIEKLKNLVAERQSTVHVSAFTVTCAYVWSTMVKAAAAIGDRTEEEKNEYFSCVADCRRRLNPPLPDNYFGNCVTGCYAKLPNSVLVGNDGFLRAAVAIGESIRRRVEDEEWMLNGEFWLSEFKEADPDRMVGVAGYPRMDLYGADFGWGKAEKVEFVSIDGGKAMSICQCRDSDDGIEVGLAMPRNKMDAFAAIFAHGLGSL